MENTIEKHGKKIAKWSAIGILGLFLLITGINSLHIIETGNVGVKSNLGTINPDELNPGVNFAIPFIEKIEPVFTKTIMVNYTGTDKKADTEEFYTETTLQGEDSSGLPLGIDLLVEVEPVSNQMADMFISVGRQGFDKKVLQPIRGVSRKVLGQFKAENIMKLRKEVEMSLRAEMDAQFAKNPYYKVVNIQLKKIYLPTKVKEAIEKVQLAKQQAKQAHEEIIKNKNLAQSKIEIATGEALAREATAKGIAKATVLEATANAEAKVLAAKANAQVIKLNADAQAIANDKIAKSLTSDLIRNNSIDAWKSGGSKVPQFVGAGSQFIYDINKKTD